MTRRPRIQPLGARTAQSRLSEESARLVRRLAVMRTALEATAADNSAIRRELARLRRENARLRRRGRDVS